MGLSIHYSGRLKDATSLPLLIEEVKEICSVYGWKYQIKEDSFLTDAFDNQESLKPIYGISFTPPESETIPLAFLSNGVMVCPTRVVFFGESTYEMERNFIYQIAVKTQYAGVTIHALIINLFRYLSEKYFKNFKMVDEGLYWETGDENLLRDKFKAYNRSIPNHKLVEKAANILEIIANANGLSGNKIKEIYNISMPTLERIFRVLREDGLINIEGAGTKTRIYKITDKTRKLIS